MKDILIALSGIFLLMTIVLSCIGSDSDCGNAKVVRGKDTININQDSIDEAYYHHKTDSMMQTIKAKSERTISNE